MVGRRARRGRQDAALRARQAWDDAADVWEDFVETGKDWSRERVHGPALVRAIGPVRGLRVLDVGCGQGRLSRQLAARGARMVAIDWSGRMLANARRHEEAKPLGIEYHRMDARRLSETSRLGRFDLVVAGMSLMDMPGLPRVVQGIAHVLRPRGRLVFSVTHPVNTAEVDWAPPADQPRRAFAIDRYFEHRPKELPWRMPRLRRPFTTVDWHRPLESWFSLLTSNGFEVRALLEPRPTLADVRAVPNLAILRGFPFFLIWVCQLGPRAPHVPRRGRVARAGGNH